MEVSSPEKITDCRWLNLFRARWRSRGETGEWIFASRRPEPIHVPGGPPADAVIVVPVHSSGRLVVIREYRIPVADYEYAFPAGLIGPGESAEECAARELLEETGLAVTAVRLVSPAVYSSTGLSDEAVRFVFVECAGEVSAAGLEATEELTVHLLDIDGVRDLCDNGRVKQSSKMWPILLMFSAMGEVKLLPEKPPV